METNLPTPMTATVYVNLLEDTGNLLFFFEAIWIQAYSWYHQTLDGWPTGGIPSSTADRPYLEERDVDRKQVKPP